MENYFRSSDPEAASRSTLDSSLLMGFDVLCNGSRAFMPALMTRCSKTT
jgi:ribose 1,5-bisphosphokinase PhnN